MSDTINPFKMIGSYIGAVIGLILGIFGAICISNSSGLEGILCIAFFLPAFPLLLLKIFNPLALIIVNIIVLFLIGWGIQLLIRKIRD